MNPEPRNTDCIFCKIIAGELPSDIVYRNDDIIAFRDINPIAPVHHLIIPRKHIPSLREMKEEDLALLGQMAVVANQLAEKEGVAERGYRLIINCGYEADQTVLHLHMHLLGGRVLTWEA